MVYQSTRAEIAAAFCYEHIDRSPQYDKHDYTVRECALTVPAVQPQYLYFTPPA